MNSEVTTHNQADAYSSPWSWSQRLKRAAWCFSWGVLCAWTPKPLNAWRLFVLRCWGAKVSGSPFIYASVRIHFPQQFELGDRACLGESVNVYNLALIRVEAGATVAQEVFLCTGTHDFNRDTLPLQTAPITIGRDAFIGARAFILPGRMVGARAVVGACAVITRDVEPDHIVAGNPAKVIGTRAGQTGD